MRWASLLLRFFRSQQRRLFGLIGGGYFGRDAFRFAFGLEFGVVERLDLEKKAGSW